jgi:predicted ATPase
MAVINESTSNTLWGYLSSLLERSDEKKHISLKTRKMLIRIQHLIHGSIKLKDDEFDYEMRYIREDNLDIPLKDAATGIKTFAYIIRLLENGCLDENTLLIIDEPEAHLHPQWIVEYARILVLLFKELGVRVLIASHNPDMVAAIQSIGAKEGIKERITFYQANKADNNYEYDYKNLGFEVTEIFQSFNIALSRIQDYGTIAD